MAKARHAKRTQAGEINKGGENSADECLLTQPMCQTNENIVLKDAKNNDLKNDGLFDLFTMSQSTQPMYDLPDSESLFVSVDGLGRDRGLNSNVCLKSSADVCTRSRTRPVSSKTIKTLPPLPPVGMRFSKVCSGFEEECKNGISKSGNLKRCATSIIKPKSFKKHLRQGSNTSVASNKMVVTKTHEVVCHVEPHNEKRNSDVNTVASAQFCKKHLCRKVNSFVETSNVRTPSFLARRRLLRKYNLNRSMLSDTNYKDQCSTYAKSPGWSRWKQMCRDLKRRSSGLRLTFNKKPKFTKRSKSNSPGVRVEELSHDRPSRSSSISSRISLSFARWGVSGSRRSKRKCNDDDQKKSMLVPETQADCPLNDKECETLYETPVFLNSQHFKHARQSKENCRFIMPLRRLSRNYFYSCSRRSNSRVSFPHDSSPMCTSFSHCSPKQHVLKDIFCTPKSNIELNHSNVADPNILLSCTDLCCHPIHCSACGETLILDGNSLQTMSPSQFSLNKIFHQSERSHSMSSSYWQAEDPGDDMRLVDCRGSLKSVNLQNTYEMADMQNSETRMQTQVSLIFLKVIDAQINFLIKLLTTKVVLLIFINSFNI